MVYSTMPQRAWQRVRITVCCYIAGFFVGGCASADRQSTFQMDQYMMAATTSGYFSGSVLVIRGEKVLLRKGYGLANQDLNVPNTPATKFRIGSISKQFAAAAILRLQEQGKLSVQDSICHYLAPCPAAWRTITIHQLLTHQSGIPSFTGFPDYTATIMLPATTEQLLARFRDRPLKFAPGTQYQYSNSGYVVLGAIVEQITAAPYEQFLRTTILIPLGLQQTGYDHADQILPQRATGYTGFGEYLRPADYIDMSVPQAAGGLYSTVDDLHTWITALLANKLLTTESVQQMTTPAREDYGYGSIINQQLNRRCIGHEGEINGFSSFLANFPDEQLTIVVLRNHDTNRLALGTIGLDLAAIALHESFTPPQFPTAIAIDPHRLDDYVGRYQITPTFGLQITKDKDRLFAQGTNQPKILLYPETDTTFFSAEIDAKIRFTRNHTSGAISGLTLLQNGAQNAKKLP